MNFTPFRAEDLIGLKVQPAHFETWLTMVDFDLPRIRVLENDYSWTARVDGWPVACCGITGDGAAWAWLSEDLRRHMVAITRRVKRELRRYPGPVTAEIDEDHPAAVDWARLLGFVRSKKGVWTHA